MRIAEIARTGRGARCVSWLQGSVRLDSEIWFRGGGDLHIAGLVATSADETAAAGVVLVGGSGPSDRSNDGFFVPIRAALCRAGITVLSYDKRGVGDSQGAWESATVDDLAADAAGALAFLRDHPGVDPDRVSLFGHSEGGWVALRTCLSEDPPSFVVLNSCPGVSLIESEVFAQEAAGNSPAEAASFRNLLRELSEMAAIGHSAGDARDRLAEERGEAWFDRPEASGFDLTATMWSQLRAWGLYDPAPDLRRCTVSTLALFGADDPLVPVQASIDAYDRTAIVAGRQQVNRVFAGAGHRMARPNSTEIVPRYLECVSRALRSS